MKIAYGFSWIIYSGNFLKNSKVFKDEQIKVLV